MFELRYELFLVIFLPTYLFVLQSSHLFRFLLLRPISSLDADPLVVLQADLVCFLVEGFIFIEIYINMGFGV